MGVLDKFLDAIKLNDDYDDEEFFDDELDDFEDEDEEKPRKKFFDKFNKKDDFDDDDFEDEDPMPRRSSKTTAAATTTKAVKQSRPAPSKITPMRSSSKKNQGMEVCVIRPTSMEDTREIADTLVDNSTVVLNLEGIDVEVAQRIIDFTSGACYSLGGSLQKVSSYIFILTPYGVEITGDFQNLLGGGIPSIRSNF